MQGTAIRVTAVVLVSVLLSCLLALPAAAAGIGVGPSKLTIPDALRGGEYERYVTVFNLGDEEAGFAFGASGDAGGWVSFSERDAPDTPVEQVSVPGHGEATVLVKVSVPQGAANGDYEAVISVTTVARAEGAGSVQAVTLSSQVALTVSVTGTQVLQGRASSIRIRDVEEGYPLRIEAFFQNTGNVEARPQFNVQIVKGGTVVATFVIADSVVRPESSEMLHLECDTSDQGCGDYVCIVEASLNGVVVAREELSFTILPRGTLSRSGACTGVVLDGSPELGTIRKLVATFVNDGQIDTMAKLVGEVYCDGVLVEVLNGDEILVPVGYTGELVAYLKLDNPGKYTVEAQVLYEGKLTDVVVLSFEVTRKAPAGTALGVEEFGWQWVLFGVLVVAMLAGLASTYWQRKHRVESKDEED